MGLRPDLAAAQTWDRQESLELTNARIHDGEVGDENLRRRADAYVRDVLFAAFPYAIPVVGAAILDIGSGVGWIMQAMRRSLEARGDIPRCITGLDIAPNMLAKARQRLDKKAPYDFVLYDGIKVPLNDQSFDLIYGVSCLQHIPDLPSLIYFLKLSGCLSRKHLPCCT